MIDETGTDDPNQKMILSIYAVSDPNDFRYSLYSTKRTVTFHDVEPDDFLAHYGSNHTIGERAVRVTVEEGAHMTITFTKYTSAQIWIPVGFDGNGYYQDYNEWKNTITITFLTPF
ncbi:MAG: hypothetical protein PF517_10710 [Salinivirgaceae bacterium]|nr:hypothetical protein [Salinivirgaceae bacterium]